MSDQPTAAMIAAGMTIPERLIYAIKFLRGDEDGNAWLTDLDEVLRDYQLRWDLRFESIAEGGAMSCCAYCIDSEDQELVLKIPVDSDTGALEALTLKTWSTLEVAPQVAARDPSTGVFLMERLRPGVTYTGIDRIEEAGAFVEMFSRLVGGRPEAGQADLPPLSKLVGERITWAQERFNAQDAAPYRPDLERAEGLATRLGEQAVQRRLVHGDLQAKNLLWGPGGRLFCIDPIAAYGDPASDAAMWAVLQDSTIPIDSILAQLAHDVGMAIENLEDWAYVVSTAELRPTQPSRFARQSEFIDSYERRRS